MYNGSSDGEGHDSNQKMTPGLFHARNLRCYVGSGAGLGSETLMELETKKTLLDVFKEMQQKNAEADTPEGLTYLFRCLDLHGRRYLTTADIHTLRDVRRKWIEGGNYELCIEGGCEG